MKNYYCTTTPISCLFSMTTLVSRHQTGRTILGFNEARDDGVAVASAGPCVNHLYFAPDRQPHQYLIIQFFYWMDALPAAQPTVSKR